MMFDTARRFRQLVPDTSVPTSKQGWPFVPPTAFELGQLWAAHMPDAAWEQLVDTWRRVPGGTGTLADLGHGFFGVPAALHFVGFRGDEYVSACRCFGTPDFIHRSPDLRFYRGGELAPHDTVVFANGTESVCKLFSFDDSSYAGGGGLHLDKAADVMDKQPA